MTPLGFEIRTAHTSDAACLVRLNADVHARHVRERPEFFRATDSGELAEWFSALLGKSTTRCWIASVDAQPAGYLLMREHQRAATVFCLARHWHEIEQVGVESQFRRRGIGRALLETALAAAAATGARDIEIASWSFNRDAHALFERCGFGPRLLRFDRRLAGPAA